MKISKLVNQETCTTKTRIGFVLAGVLVGLPIGYMIGVYAACPPLRQWLERETQEEGS